MLILAHGLGGRSDLPVPLWLALYGGAAAVVVSFVVLGAFWRRPKLTGSTRGRPLPGIAQRAGNAPVTGVVLRALGVVLFAITLLAAVLGPDSSTSNPAPTWLYVWFWVGLVPASLLFGPVWHALNPLRALSSGLARLSGDPEQRFVQELPERVGYWPAAAGLFVFVWLELVYERSDDPLTVFVFLALYALVHIRAALRYGNRWYARGDGFEVYSTLLSHLAPLGRDESGRLVLRNPFEGLASLKSGPGLVAVVAVLLGSTAFDGLTRTEWWGEISARSAGVTSMIVGTAGLLAAIGLVALTYLGATRVSAIVSRRTRERLLRGLEGRFVHSLVPIVVGYTIAHYFSLLVFQGQAGYILASDPFGLGWDLFGTAEWSIDYLAVSTQAIALIQVGAIVLGHIAGVVAAHDRAVGLFAGADKTRSQYSLLAVMVTYTVGGIALLVGV